MSTALRGRIARLEKAWLSGCCPKCADWPAEILVRLVEVVVEIGPDGKPLGDVSDVPAPDPAQFGPCAGCGRLHRARVVEFNLERQ